MRNTIQEKSWFAPRSAMRLMSIGANEVLLAAENQLVSVLPLQYVPQLDGNPVL